MKITKISILAVLAVVVAILSTGCNKPGMVATVRVDDNVGIVVSNRTTTVASKHGGLVTLQDQVCVAGTGRSPVTIYPTSGTSTVSVVSIGTNTLVRVQ